MTTSTRNRMALAHAGVVRQQALRLRAHAPYCYEVGDLESWGWIAILAALGQYDGRRGELAGYLRKKIEFGIYDGLREAEHSRRQVQPMFESMEDSQAQACATQPDAVQGVLLRECWNAIEKLPERWQDVLRRRYLRHQSGRQIGAALGLSQGRISQIHAAAMRKLRGMLAA